MCDIVDCVRILDSNSSNVVMMHSNNLYTEIEKRKICKINNIVKEKGIQSSVKLIENLDEVPVSVITTAKFKLSKFTSLSRR